MNNLRITVCKNLNQIQHLKTFMKSFTFSKDCLIEKVINRIYSGYYRVKIVNASELFTNDIVIVPQFNEFCTVTKIEEDTNKTLLELTLKHYHFKYPIIIEKTLHRDDEVYSAIEVPEERRLIIKSNKMRVKVGADTLSEGDIIRIDDEVETPGYYEVVKINQKE
jgi:hypothetical protein